MSTSFLESTQSARARAGALSEGLAIAALGAVASLIGYVAAADGGSYFLFASAIVVGLWKVVHAVFLMERYDVYGRSRRSA